MKPGETVGSIVLESTQEIDLAFDAVDQMELCLVNGEVTADDTERVCEVLSNAEDEITLSVEDSRVALMGLELAVGSNWMRRGKRHIAEQMLNEYKRKNLHTPTEA